MCFALKTIRAPLLHRVPREYVSRISQRMENITEFKSWEILHTPVTKSWEGTPSEYVRKIEDIFRFLRYISVFTRVYFLMVEVQTFLGKSIKCPWYGTCSTPWDDLTGLETAW